MNDTPLDAATLRNMAEAMSDLQFTPAELERILPYINQYLTGMEKVAHIELATEPPASPRK